MKILIAAATFEEIKPLFGWLSATAEKQEDFVFQMGDHTIFVLVTGVGMTYTAYSLTRFFSQQQIDLAINAGIAGSYRPEIEIGAVVQVSTEEYGDLGVEKADGSFHSAIEMGLIDGNVSPFQNGKLIHPNAKEMSFLKAVNGLTVNSVHGSQASIEAVRDKFDPDIETMEGAAFFQVCLLENISFLAIRSISNFVEPRNRDNWNIPLSISRLNNTIQELLTSLIK